MSIPGTSTRAWFVQAARRLGGEKSLVGWALLGQGPVDRPTIDALQSAQRVNGGDRCRSGFSHGPIFTMAPAAISLRVTHRSLRATASGMSRSRRAAMDTVSRAIWR